MKQILQPLVYLDLQENKEKVYVVEAKQVIL